MNITNVIKEVNKEMPSVSYMAIKLAYKTYIDDIREEMLAPSNLFISLRGVGNFAVHDDKIRKKLLFLTSGLFSPSREIREGGIRNLMEFEKFMFLKKKFIEDKKYYIEQNTSHPRTAFNVKRCDFYMARYDRYIQKINQIKEKHEHFTRSLEKQVENSGGDKEQDVQA